jgi:phospholipase C
MISAKTMRTALLAMLLVPLAAHCGGRTDSTVPPPLQSNVLPQALQPGATVLPLGGGKIAHVVIIVQENRSFDNLFHGFPGADTANSGTGIGGKKYVLAPWSMTNPWDINHAHLQFLEDYDGGKMDGFSNEIKSLNTACSDPRNTPSCWVFWGGSVPSIAYSYLPKYQVQPYWTLAMTYALGDRMFQSNNGPSYPSHQYLIAGQSGHVAENPSFPTPTPPPPTPWGCDAPASQTTVLLVRGPTAAGLETPGPFPCFTYRTIAKRLDAKSVTWAYYAPGIGQNVGEAWSAFDAIQPVRFGLDWERNVRSPETRIFNDIAANRLPAVSWVIPALVNSDHAGSRSDTGPQWVASIVNAIGTSAYWKSTAIVVIWDDWGGWYDHVPPPQYHDPKTGVYEGLGFRVPVIVVSPYARKHYVSHKQHEIASTLHLVESVFGIGTLGLADARADALEDMFDFTQAPSPFKPIRSTMSPRDFMKNAFPDLPPDDD